MAWARTVTAGKEDGATAVASLTPSGGWDVRSDWARAGPAASAAAHASR